MKKNNYLGKFIVFEGLDGSGQSTQASKLVDFLNRPEQKLRLGHAGAHLTKEPTPNLIGGLIRSQLNGDWKSSQECLQLLFTADRAHHLEREIIPLLERGITVVCDRYFFSTVAFGSIGIKDSKWLLDLNKNFLMPDFIFLLKVSPKICISRIQGARYSTELFEKENLLTEIWKEYDKLSKGFKNTCVINGEKPVDKVFEDIKKVIDKK